MTDPDANPAEPTGPASPFPPPPALDAPRRWPWVVLALVAVLVASGIVLSRWNVDYYVITPGTATPVAPLITVPPDQDHKLTGTILLTDVYVSPLNALSYLHYRYFSSDSQVLPESALLGPSTPADQFVDQGYLDMTQAQSYATAAALTYLGHPVSSHSTGALVYGVAPGTPAASALKVGQVITALDGQPTRSGCALITGLHGRPPGSVITLSVEQSTITPSGDFKAGPIVRKQVRLARPPAGLIDAGCSAKPVKATSYLGIQSEDQVAWQFPVKVTVHTADIGGPSAGLAMTLGIIDKLSGGDLTGRRIVAATGTISPSGAVGDVGGVAEKTIAVERAGATVFFVPPEELAAARSKETPQLHVYAVSNLDQALRILKKLGGHVPASHASAQRAP